MGRSDVMGERERQPSSAPADSGTNFLQEPTEATEQVQQSGPRWEMLVL